MNDLTKVYYLTDNSCEPLDPLSLSVDSMSKKEWFEKYGSYDWSFDSYAKAVVFMMERFKHE